ncbi:MAG: VWA domain-containing protein [Phycisphaerales bacterium]|nr:MAG: VWA domain-containing protein [Phycisphaerales bacterium]
MSVEQRRASNEDSVMGCNVPVCTMIIAALLSLISACSYEGSPSVDLCEAVECAEGEQCVDGQCVVVEPETECVGDEECADGWVCQERLCVAADSAGDDNGTSPVDPCDEVTCAVGETCVDGECISESPGSVCISDADCGEGEICQGSACVPGTTSHADLEPDNPGLTFANLIVGQVYALIAPDPTESEDAPEDPETDAEARPAPEDCTCAWSVDPAGAIEFTLDEQCAAEATVAQAGNAVLTVVVGCGGVESTYSQDVVAVVETVPCETDDDCTDLEVCAEGICVERVGPSVELITDQSRSPFIVSLDLRLEDSQGEPIPEGVIQEHFRIFENELEIDYEETAVYVTPAPDLPHKIILVLDYTKSMESAGAISPMVSAAQQFVSADHFTANHSIGIVEFHDRTEENYGFSVAVPLTKADADGKDEILYGIPVSGELEAGLSRMWDAVDKAISLLTEVERQPGEVRSIVFLTDGRDTTSTADADVVSPAAVAGGISLLPIGFGDVAEAESVLRSLADDTGGAYFAAADGDALAEVFEQIALDLRGQWNLRYLTQQNSGTADLRVEFTWDGATGTIAHSVNVGEIDGDIHEGVLQVLDCAYDSQTDRTEFLLRADYIPRNVSRFALAFAQTGTTFSFTDSGGLISAEDGWVIVSGANSRYDLFGPSSLELGAFGDIGLASVSGLVNQLQVAHDDATFDYLAQPKTVAFSGEFWLSPLFLTLTVEPLGAGSITRNPDKLAYATGESVTLTAVADDDYVFNQWSGGATGTDSSVTVTMDTDVAVTADFYPPRQVTVVVEPAGAGSVTVSPDKSAYAHGTTVTLTAVPAGTTFSRWSGDASGTDLSTTVTMNADKTVTATFVTP